MLVFGVRTPNNTGLTTAAFPQSFRAAAMVRTWNAAPLPDLENGNQDMGE